MATDPYRSIRRQHEMLRRAFAAPLEQFSRNQRVLDQALGSPLSDMAGLQEQMAGVLRAPALRALSSQDAVTRALQGPIHSILESDAHIRKVLQGPLEQIARNQQALSRAFAEPYGALLRNQDLLLAAMGAAAAEIELDSQAIADPASEEAVWLAQWGRTIREWAPSPEQAREFLSDMSFILAVAVIALTLADEAPAAEVVQGVSILFGACAFLLRYVDNR